MLEINVFYQIFKNLVYIMKTVIAVQTFPRLEQWPRLNDHRAQFFEKNKFSSVWELQLCFHPIINRVQIALFRSVLAIKRNSKMIYLVKRLKTSIDKEPTLKSLNPYTPVAQQVADEVVFTSRFQGEGVEFFFNRTSLTSLRFLMSIFWKIPIWAFPAFILLWVLYQDHLLSQMVL